MSICEFCDHYREGGCYLGLKAPKTMTCREFSPVIAQFCSDPKDFVSANQIVQMATFFGFQRLELKKIKLMATEAENARAQKLADESTATVTAARES